MTRDPGTAYTRPMTILVIDDDVASVGAMSHFLRKLRFDVIAAYDALSATTEAVKAVPDLIIMDYEMPAGNGAMVYQRLRNIAATADVPVIFVSGLGVEALRASVPPRPNLRYLAKPVDFDDVARCLGELLPGRAGLGDAPADGPLDLDA